MKPQFLPSGNMQLRGESLEVWQVVLFDERSGKESLAMTVVCVTCINAGIRAVLPRGPWPVQYRTALSLTLECGFISCQVFWTGLLTLLPKERTEAF